MAQIGDGDNNDDFAMKFTFAVVVRGEISDIKNLIEFLKNSKLVIAHKELGEEKLWITKAGDHSY